MKKIIRITTSGGSLKSLLKGQLNFLNQYFLVLGVGSSTVKMDEVEKQEQIKTKCIEMKREISIYRDLVALCNLCVLFVKEKPYIVHANTPKASLLSMIAAWITRVPNRIYTVTGLRFETTTGMFRKLLIMMEKITCFCATKVIPEGLGVRNTLINNNITDKPLVVIHNGNINGVDTDYFSANSITESKEKLRSIYNIANDDMVYIFVGRIVKDKGISELVRCFIKLQESRTNIKLLLVGSYDITDPIPENIKTLILNTPSIIEVGFQKDVRPFYKMADVLTFPSYREGFPNVVLQAGAMNLPSIVTDINGSNEIVINNRTGIIVPPKSEKKLFQAMLLYYEKPSLLSIHAASTRMNIINKYSQEDVWAETLKMYQSL